MNFSLPYLFQNCVSPLKTFYKFEKILYKFLLFFFLSTYLYQLLVQKLKLNVQIQYNIIIIQQQQQQSKLYNIQYNNIMSKKTKPLKKQQLDKYVDMDVQMCRQFDNIDKIDIQKI
eukprot:TRINITY_DN21804_c5_g1_i1.p1 TRINITY_DN21804_c5_g1~~TRINITY_DN21804_c5_g1_i1.p1  ORF type:complete len:131 (-),score=0.14 TRINITY_DN21804_c5_g1_i1:207-554(-)